MTPREKLKALGIALSESPRPVANYVPYRLVGPFLFLSGQGPRQPDGGYCTGKVDADVPVEDAYQHARLVVPVRTA